MSKSIEQLLDELIAREGGYVNDPNDRGGATKFGITEAVARAHGYRGAMRDLPIEEAKAIYRRIYWLKPRLDKVAQYSPRVADEMFDTGVNMGPAVAARFLQTALTALNRQARDYPDLAIDGRIGPATLGALEAFLALRGVASGSAVLVAALDAQQGARYLDLARTNPTQEKYLFGWLNNRLGNAA